MTAEERAQRIIRKANEKGYNREDDFSAACYFIGNQQYFDHDFAKAFFPKHSNTNPYGCSVHHPADWGWKEKLQELVLIEGDLLSKLDYLEQFI